MNREQKEQQRKHRTGVGIVAIVIVSFVIAGLLIANNNTSNDSDSDSDGTVYWSTTRVVTVDARNWKNWAHTIGPPMHCDTSVFIYVSVNTTAFWTRYTSSSIAFHKVNANETILRDLVNVPLYCQNGSSVIFHGVNAHPWDNGDTRTGHVVAMFRYNATWWMRILSFTNGYPEYDELVFTDILPRIIALTANETM